MSIRAKGFNSNHNRIGRALAQGIITDGAIEDCAQGNLFDSTLEGICIACGYPQEGVEPDAENYPCEECGECAVFGGEQLLLYTQG